MVRQTFVHSPAWGLIGWKPWLKHTSIISQTCIKVQRELSGEMPEGLAGRISPSPLVRDRVT